MVSFPIYFIRHGQTDWNKELRFQGQQDIPINETGRAQAMRNGRVLAQSLKDLKDLSVYVSPLGRTRQTFELVLEAGGFEKPEVIYDERLLEVSFGDWEGITRDELLKRLPGQIEDRDKAKWFNIPPNGESYDMLAERVRLWLEEQTGPCLVVAHGGTMRVLRYWLEKLPKQEAVKFSPPQDQILHWDGQRVNWL
ncbi:MAG: histidine phosphatase family protein [Cohaesibacter sp.]|nr:histidine phosphatase family protein [Cohaesibacter sp.]